VPGAGWTQQQHPASSGCRRRLFAVSRSCPYSSLLHNATRSLTDQAPLSLFDLSRHFSSRFPSLIALLLCLLSVRVFYASAYPICVSYPVRSLDDLVVQGKCLDDPSRCSRNVLPIGEHSFDKAVPSEVGFSIPSSGGRLPFVSPHLCATTRSLHCLSNRWVRRRLCFRVVRPSVCACVHGRVEAFSDQLLVDL